MARFVAGLVPPRATWRETLRPWKLATFAGSMAVMLYGALVMDISDWDVGVTLLMGTETYLLAPWCAQLLWRAWRDRPVGATTLVRVLVSLAVAVFVVDTSYVAYHRWAGNTMLRADNFQASMPLFYLAGVLWSWDDTLRELWRRVRAAFAR